MKDTKTVLFDVGAQDYRTVQLWLEALDREGWVLETVKGLQFPRAKLRRRAGPSVRYCVDVADSPLKSYEQRDAYLALCADAGWELVVSFRGLNLFRAQPGRDPVPIQTDPELECRRLWRQVALPNLAVCALVLLLPLVLWGAALQSLHLFTFFMSDLFLLLLVCLLLALVSIPVAAASSLAFALRLRRDTLPPPDLKKARRKGRWSIIGAVLSTCISILIYGVILHGIFANDFAPPVLEKPPVVTWADLGRAGSDCWGREGGTFLLSYRQSTQSIAVEVRYPDTPELLVAEYRAAYPWVADLVYAGLRREVPADTPRLAVLRFGDTVLRLEGPVNFLDAELQGVIAANLAGR